MSHSINDDQKSDDGLEDSEQSSFKLDFGEPAKKTETAEKEDVETEVKPEVEAHAEIEAQPVPETEAIPETEAEAIPKAIP